MRVAILGAGGTIAPAIVRDLAESDEVAELLLVDLDREKAQATADGHGGGKAAVADDVAGADVVVNSAGYRINLDAMRSCLDAGAHYIDLGGLYWMTGKQLELHEEFERAGLLAILGMGSSPGKTNVMAVRAARALGVARLETVDVSAGGRDLDPPEGESFPYALQTLVDELTMKPIVVRGGEPVEIEPMSPGGTVRFADPIGEGDTIHTIHSEMRTFPESFGCREATFRLSLAPTLLERLRELAAVGDEERAAAAAAAKPPSGATVSSHVVEVSARGRVARVTSFTPPYEAWGLGGGIVSTAAPAAAAVRLLARGEIEARGALPPERCIDPDALFPELERRGNRIETVTEVPA
ncbi:MAG TPA: saccharopine dehydrogenase NADP-binding domain-containing protein [Thermoleophilaceae bacterium]|nr:saccharopine dehydrogenase NADP-binding domain-containing protein [Thermoleophilaceae bacterium]